MAQLPGDPRVNQYVASAGQTTFTYDFKIYHDDEVTVQKGETTLTLTTDYTVTDAGEEAGGTVILNIGAALNDIITLTGDTMVERDAIFTEGGDFSADALNGEFNKVLNIMSEGVTAFQRSVRLEVYDPNFDPKIIETTARRAIVVNAAGTGFEMTANDPDAQTSDAQAWAVVAEGHANDALTYATDASSYADDAAGDAGLAAQSAADAQQSADDAAASAASINLTALASDIIPDVTLTRSLGSYSSRWSTVWGGNGLFYGQLFASQDLNVSGDIKVATDKFVVTGATGNVAVNTNKFTVDAATGNTVVAGTLMVGGVPVGSGSKFALYTADFGQNVGGGTYTTGSWMTRPINTEKYDDIGITLASNELSLPSGKYLFHVNVGSYYTLYTQYRIYDLMADEALETIGTDFVADHMSWTGGVVYASWSGATGIRIEMAASKTTVASGMGLASNMGPERYLSLLVERIGD